MRNKMERQVCILGCPPLLSETFRVNTFQSISHLAASSHFERCIPASIPLVSPVIFCISIQAKFAWKMLPLILMVVETFEWKVSRATWGRTHCIPAVKLSCFYCYFHFVYLVSCRVFASLLLVSDTLIFSFLFKLKQIPVSGLKEWRVSRQKRKDDVSFMLALGGVFNLSCFGCRMTLRFFLRQEAKRGIKCHSSERLRTSGRWDSKSTRTSNCISFRGEKIPVLRTQG